MVSVVSVVKYKIEIISKKTKYLKSKNRWKMAITSLKVMLVKASLEAMMLLSVVYCTMGVLPMVTKGYNSLEIVR